MTRDLIVGAVCMTIIVTASNILVLFPINDWLTWAAFTYPMSFLVTDLTNRRLGPQKARRVVYVGFCLAVVFSIILATPRIAIASGTAFLFAQLLDVQIFQLLRRAAWWAPPFVSSTIASILDTLLFFGLAFAFTGLPWVTWAVGDYTAKAFMAALLLVPFRALFHVTAPAKVEAPLQSRA